MRERRSTDRRRKDRVLRRWFWWAVIATSAVIVGGITYSQGCSGGESVTLPETPVVQAPAPQEVTPQVVTPAEPAADPGGGQGPVSVVCGSGGCKLSNSGNAPHEVKVACTRPLEADPVYGLTTLMVPIGSDTVTVQPEDVCNKGLPELRCEDVTRKVQLDFTAGGGEHIGHLLTTVKYEGNPEDGWVLIQDEPIITFDYGDWSECQPLEGPSWGDKPKCEPEKEHGIKTRSVTKIITVNRHWENQCDAGERESPEPVITHQQLPPETQPCTYETGNKVCDTSICHTENKRYCFLWFDGWHCDNRKHDLYQTKLWQCQNVPPGVPGHYPNHFDSGGHDDFFGSCGWEHCYNITN